MYGTFREFVWEWGPLPICLLAALHWAAYFLIPLPLGAWLMGFIDFPLLAWVCYWVSVVVRYPCRGDLPEWKERHGG